MTNNEKLFRLLGWKECSISNRGDGWKDTRHIQHLNLPDVSNFFELCRRWIIPEMRGKHIYYEIKFNKFHWYFSGFNERPFKYLSAVEIIDDNIAAALVESAIEVLGKDNG